MITKYVPSRFDHLMAYLNHSVELLHLRGCGRYFSSSSLPGTEKELVIVALSYPRDHLCNSEIDEVSVYCSFLGIWAWKTCVVGYCVWECITDNMWGWGDVIKGTVALEWPVKFSRPITNRITSCYCNRVIDEFLNWKFQHVPFYGHICGHKVLLCGLFSGSKWAEVGS